MLSKSSDPTKESTHLKKIFIETCPSFAGLSGNPETLKFSSFNLDPIYKVPSISQVCMFIEENECFWPDHVNVSAFFELLHANSPFKAGSHCEAKSGILQEKIQHLAPNNSVCVSSLQDLSFGSIEKPFNLAEELAKEKNYLNVSTGPMPQKHSRFDQVPFNSASSINASDCKDSTDRVLNFSNLELSLSAEGHRLYQRLEDFTEILSNDEVIYTITNESWKKPQVIAELLPEHDEELSWMFFKSIEALAKAKIPRFQSEEDNFSSPDDEGPILIGPGRSFLNGDTASKSKLSGALNINRQIKPLPPKTLSESSDLVLSTIPELSPLDLPDRLSPISKKLALIHYKSSNKHSQVRSLLTCSGFTSTLSVEFSCEESKTRGFNQKENYERSLWFGLLHSAALSALDKAQVTWLSAGFEHMAACDLTGRVYTWGYGASGCLGHGDKANVHSPRAVRQLAQGKIVYIECGGYHNVALSEEGEVYVWGRADVNQLALDLPKIGKDEVGFVALEPVLLEELRNLGIKVKALACGEAHTLLLDSEGTLMAFGWSDDGQLGTGKSESTVKVIKNVEVVEGVEGKIVKIAAGAIFSACVTDEGQVWAWGNGEQGQLGLGQGVKSSRVPVLVEFNGEDQVLDLVCGESSVICLCRSGKVWAWGQGVAGFFNDSSLYPFGSDIICFAPRVLASIKSVQEYMMTSKHYED